MPPQDPVQDIAGAFVFEAPNYLYEIPHDRCNSPEKLLGWLLRLAPKNWVTKRHLELLVLLAGDRFPAMKPDRSM